MTSLHQSHDMDTIYRPEKDENQAPFSLQSLSDVLAWQDDYIIVVIVTVM